MIPSLSLVSLSAFALTIAWHQQRPSLSKPYPPITQQGVTFTKYQRLEVERTFCDKEYEILKISDTRNVSNP